MPFCSGWAAIAQGNASAESRGVEVVSCRALAIVFCSSSFVKAITPLNSKYVRQGSVDLYMEERTADPSPFICGLDAALRIVGEGRLSARQHTLVDKAPERNEGGDQHAGCLGSRPIAGGRCLNKHPDIEQKRHSMDRSHDGGRGRKPGKMLQRHRHEDEKPQRAARIQLRRLRSSARSSCFITRPPSASSRCSQASSRCRKRSASRRHACTRGHGLSGAGNRCRSGERHAPCIGCSLGRGAPCALVSSKTAS